MGVAKRTSKKSPERRSKRPRGLRAAATPHGSATRERQQECPGVDGERCGERLGDAHPHVAPVEEGTAEVESHGAEKPDEEALDERAVEPVHPVERGDGFGGEANVLRAPRVRRERGGVSGRGRHQAEHECQDAEKRQYRRRRPAEQEREHGENVTGDEPEHRGFLRKEEGKASARRQRSLHERPRALPYSPSKQTPVVLFLPLAPGGAAGPWPGGRAAG